MLARHHLASTLIGLLLAAAGCDKAASRSPDPEPPARIGQAVSAGPAEPVVAPAAAKYTLVEAKPARGTILEVVGAAQREASARKQRLFVELHASWCEPCVAIAKSMSDPRMARAFEGTYIVRVDIDAWSGKDLTAAGYESGAIPIFYEVGPDRRPTGYAIDGGAWGENIPANMAPPLAAFFAGKAKVD